MSKISIRNFGPIKDGYAGKDSFIDIGKCTVFIGNNGTGKSTIAKLISTFSWLEKALTRGDFTVAEAARKNRFERTCAYQGLISFFKSDSQIRFFGDAFDFEYSAGRLSIMVTDTTDSYQMPKIMYVPAERNFVSVVETPEKLKYLPANLYEFLDEYIMARDEYNELVQTPIAGLHFQFNKQKGARIIGSEYSIPLSEASSGIQSAIPLFIVTKELASSIDEKRNPSKNERSVKEEQRRRQRILQLLRKSLSEEEFVQEISRLSVTSRNERFLNIIEEIEQNLFPSSQKDMLYSMLSFANMKVGNSLILTTHSPYIINYLSIAIQAGQLAERAIKVGKLDNVGKRISSILPSTACMAPGSVTVYETTEQGEIIKLPDFEGIPTDKNYLNQSLAGGNRMFDCLLEIEEEL